MNARLTLNYDPEELSPVELRDGRWYKRDDSLRYSNGVNGKTRTSLFLGRLAAERGASALVYGGSVHAPALGRVASAANYLGLDSHIFIGSDPSKAVRHETVRVAVEAGAQLHRSPIAFNPGLQKRAKDLAEGSGGEIFQVPYGVSAADEWPDDLIREFLEQDADQVLNVTAEPEIKTLAIAFGSGNATAGMLYGLATRGTGALETVKLIGVGPDKRDWLDRRLCRVGIDLADIDVDIEYIPLHPHFAEYTDRMPATVDGIDFHPRYEGKVIRFLDMMRLPWWTARDGSTCLWIVGGPL